jgi:hypothetical protein
MAETKQKRTFESAVTFKPAALKAAHTGLPSLEELTPSRFARLNAKQRKEMTIKLIEFLKTF